jgi:hypothetical protein
MYSFHIYLRGGLNPGGAPPGGKPAGGKPGAPGNPAGGNPPGKPGGGAPRPGKPGGAGPPGKPGKAGGGAAPPTPAAGPASEMGAAAPRPAALATPGPAARVVATPPTVDFPSRVLGSAGGGDSTDRDTIWAPRTMVKPRVRFSSCSMVWVVEDDAPGAEDWACFFLIRRNSSVSARTRFMCCICVSGPPKGNIDSMAATYLVEGEQLPGHLAAVIEGYSHPVVDLTHC